MEFKGLTDKLFVVFDWITRLAYVNLLWIGFTLLGFIAFGFFPATSALFTVTRQWVRGDGDVPVFSLFWKTYKSDFIKANMIGLILIGLGIVLYMDYLYFSSSGSILFFFLKSFAILLLILYGLMLVTLFPVHVHYKQTMMQLFRNAFIVALVSPFRCIIMALGAVTIGVLMFLMPSLLPFFGGSTIALFLTWMMQKIFYKIESRKGHKTRSK